MLPLRRVCLSVCMLFVLCCNSLAETDILFLLDTTGSMGGPVSDFKEALSEILEAIDANSPCSNDNMYSLADYRNYTDGGNYQAYGVNLDLPFTYDTNDVLTAIDNLTADGGGDTPESQLKAMETITDNWLTTSGDLGFNGRAYADKIIVWAGDAPGHDSQDSSYYPSLEDVIDGLTSEDITVFALNPFYCHLGLNQEYNGHQQATEITEATGGELFCDTMANLDYIKDTIVNSIRCYNFFKFDNLDDANSLDCRSPGQSLTYTICWENDSTETLEGVSIVDLLPGGVTYDFLIGTDPFVIDPNYSDPNHIYEWYIGDITPGQSGCVTLEVKVNEHAAGGMYLHNTAQLWSGNTLLAAASEDTLVCCWGDNPNVIFVDQSAVNGANTGINWQNAYLDLSDALERAEYSICGGEPFTIYVAQGTYSPGPSEYDTFGLPDNVKMYGGFRTGGTDFEYRNPDIYETVLDGMVDPNEIECNDIVVTIGENTLMDGFIVRDGFEYGLFSDGSSFTIKNCKVIDNDQSGIYAKDGNVEVKWCEVGGNKWHGIEHEGQGYTINIENCVIIKNEQHGLFILHSIPKVKNCVVAGNGDSSIGYEGIYIDLSFNNSKIYNNTIVHNKKSGVKFVANEPNSLAYPEIHNNILWYNNDGQGQLAGEDPNFIFYNCIYDGNDFYGTDYTPDINGNFSGNPGFAYNDPNQYDDPDIPFNYHLAYDSPCINMGNPSLTYIDQNDIDAEQREIGGRVDIGADEVFSCDGNLSADDIYNQLDRNADGILNYGEFVHFSCAWLTHDPCDPAIYDPNYVPEYDYYNDPNHQLYVDIEGGELDRWDAKCNLADTGGSRYFIDMDDLMIFCRDGYWLWTACWKESQMNRFPRTAAPQTEGGQAMMTEPVPMKSASAEPASAATSAEGIAEIIDFVDAAIAGNPPNADALYDMKIFLEETITDLQ